MIRRVLTDAYAANLDYTRRLCAGLSEDDSVLMPQPGMNHPRWIVGHLLSTTNHMIAVNIFGLDSVLPAEWREMFSPASEPVANGDAYPPLAELLSLLEERHGTVAEAVLAASPDFFERSSPSTLPEGFRQRFPTVGHALLYTMVGHESMHLGQFSTWRRVRSLPRV